VAPEVWIALLAGALVALLAWVVWLLTRMRRLEGRVAQAWVALDTQLQRRAGLAEELARSYPAAVGEEWAALLARAAAEARSAAVAPGTGDRELAENGLGRTLRDLPDDLPGVPTALQQDIAGTGTRVVLARRFYNDAVRDTRALRGGRLPRLLRLHAGRPLPRFFDIDDRLDGLPAGADGAGRAPR
jgi:hypothetical protein